MSEAQRGELIVIHYHILPTTTIKILKTSKENLHADISRWREKFEVYQPLHLLISTCKFSLLIFIRSVPRPVRRTCMLRLSYLRLIQTLLKAILLTSRANFWSFVALVILSNEKISLKCPMHWASVPVNRKTNQKTEFCRYTWTNTDPVDSDRLLLPSTQGKQAN